MNFRGSGALGRQRHPPTIDLTPLIDIVFLLLIFFLITTTFVKERKPSIPIEVPEAQSAESLPQDQHVTVHIGRDGRIFVDDEEKADAASLAAVFAALKARNPAATVLIRADAESQHGVVVRVMDTARRAGLKKFGIVSRKR